MQNLVANVYCIYCFLMVSVYIAIYMHVHVHGCTLYMITLSLFTHPCSYMYICNIIITLYMYM